MDANKKKSHRLQEYRRKWKYVLTMVPILFFFVLFAIVPNVAVIPLSLYDWSPIKANKEFVGMKNFRLMFTDGIGLQDTLETAGNTLVYILGLFVIQTVLSLILSLALQKNTTKNKFFRAFFFIPMVFSSTMVSLTWAFMYDANLGVINNIMSFFNPDKFPGVNFFDNRIVAVILIVVVHIWANIGYPITILTSGLNTISGDLSEAAMIDGANAWQTFTKITFPLLMPTIFRLSLMTVATGAMASDYVVMIGSKGATMPYDTWAASMFKGTFNMMDYGGVSAQAVLMFILLAIASAVQFVAMQKVENKVLG